MATFIARPLRRGQGRGLIGLTRGPAREPRPGASGVTVNAVSQASGLFETDMCAGMTAPKRTRNTERIPFGASALRTEVGLRRGLSGFPTTRP